MKKRSSQGLLFHPVTRNETGEVGGGGLEIDGEENIEENDTVPRLRDKCHRMEPKCQPDIVNNMRVSQNITLVCLA